MSILPAASVAPWSYPFWIAHRGAGRLAPENTLAAFAVGHAHGYRMFECDARLSADGEVFLLHDDRLGRTTDGSGDAVAQPWSVLAGLDAGAWHGRAFVGERLPTLVSVIDFCAAHACLLNVEIKPAPGDAARTGRRVAEVLSVHRRAVPVLLSSFEPAALAAAAEVAADLPRGLLLETFRRGWMQEARMLGCMAVIAECAAWTPQTAAEAAAAGLRRLAYTVNDDAEAERLRALGLDGLITDRIDHFRP